MDKPDLDWEILECIDDALDLLGEKTKFNIYWRLLIVENIDKKSIVYNPQIFLSVLEKTFGLGALSLEREIVAKIKARFGIRAECESLVIAIRMIRAS